MKERIYRSIPFVMVILGVFGVLITDQLWVAIMSLAGVWLLPSPVAPTMTIKREPNVSRETSVDTVPDNVSRETSLAETVASIAPSAWSRENLPVPCVVMHGTAEPHIPGCEGWTSDLP